MYNTIPLHPLPFCGMQPAMNDQPIWTDLFLRQLRGHGLVNTAATAAGVTKRAIDRLRLNDAEFDYACECAIEAAADELELEARRRAVDGIEKGVWYQGEEVGTELHYSDGLLTTLLKAKRADEFAERKQITGAGGKPLTVVVRSFGDPDAPPPAADTRPVIEGQFITLPGSVSAFDAALRAGNRPETLADVFDMV